MSYEITAVRRDPEGRITNVRSTFGDESAESVIQVIEWQTRTYYTEVGGLRADVAVYQGTDPKCLVSTPEGTATNNVDQLPEF